MPRKPPAFLLLLLILVGCAPTLAVRQAGPQVVAGVFAVETPTTWIEMRESSTLVIWADDPRDSQVVFVTGIQSGGSYAPVKGGPLFFPEMAPGEIARMTLNSHVQHSGHTDARIHDVTEAEFAGQPGFRFTYSYITPSKHPVRSTFQGAVVNDRLYMIGFTALEERGTYERGWPDAERIIQSARIIGVG